jgi:hypothetical protein
MRPSLGILNIIKNMPKGGVKGVFYYGRYD